MRINFDHGTLVLDEPCDLADCVFDARIGKTRAPAHRYALIRAELTRRGVAVADDVCPTLPPPAHWKPLSLRPYQQDALAAWRAAGDRGVIVLPTGAGKTRAALAAMAALHVRTLCLVPTRVLLEQWENAIRAAYCGPIGVLGDGQRTLEAVTVTTFESAYRRMATLGNRFDLLVVDEVHHFGGGQRDEALWMATAPARLGLTATPAPSERLDVLLGPVVYQLAIADLSGAHLAPFSFVVLHAELTAEERACYAADAAIYLRELAAFKALAPGASWAEFRKSAARTTAGREAIDAWHRIKSLLGFPAAKRLRLRELLARHRPARTLVFTADTRTAYAIAREHLIMPITGEIDRVEREQALAHFRAGRLRTLVSARVLNEGLDVPDAEVAIIVSAALGARELIQRVGRVLRPAPDKRAIVYELIAPNTLEERRAQRKHHALRH